MAINLPQIIYPSLKNKCHPNKLQRGKSWLVDLSRSIQLRLDLFHRFDAAAANGRMFGVPADVRFPMPAALAFLAVGVFDNYAPTINQVIGCADW